MADAKKCDICGKFYDYYDNFNTIGIKKINRSGTFVTGGDYDCCPDCMTAVKVFIGTLKESYKMED